MLPNCSPRHTILAWFRKLAAAKYDSSTQRKKPGRPSKADEIRELVIRLARENLGWGYTKIRDALRGLKIEISRSTVVNILAEAGVEPAPERIHKRTWKQLLRSHWKTLYLCDFFAVETLGMFGIVRIMVFVVIELASLLPNPATLIVWACEHAKISTDATKAKKACTLPMVDHPITTA